MSYCRWGWHGSDVYIYGTEMLGERSIVCCGCPDGRCLTYGDLLAHISAHRAAGDHVPAFVDAQIHAEIADPVRQWVPVGDLPQVMHPDPGIQRPEPERFRRVREAIEQLRED